MAHYRKQKRRCAPDRGAIHPRTLIIYTRRTAKAMASFVTNHKTPYPALDAAISLRPLKDKAVFITGAGRGVGEHLATQIAEAGLPPSASANKSLDNMTLF